MRSPSLVAAVLLCACTPSGPTVEDTSPTWFKNVEPIVTQSCAGCHTRGGVAPFALQTYADVKAQLPAVAAAVASGKMPPWMPDEDNCQPLRDSRKLSADERETLLDWAESGAREGNPVDHQALDSTPLELAWVDKQLELPTAYTPRSDRVDDYRCFAVDLDLSAPRDLIGFDVKPDQRQEVHHAVLFAASREEAARLDAEDAEPGWTCYGSAGGNISKILGGWAPGAGATRFPGGTGVGLYSGDVVVIQMHYNTSRTAPVPDRSSVALQFAKNPISYRALMFPMYVDDFAVPPHSMGYTKSNEAEVPLSNNVWGGIPHMHTRGRKIRVEKVSATGEATCLLDVPAWNFAWQQFYFLKAPRGVTIEAGEKLRQTCTWDNDTDQTLQWGEGTEDEMCLSFLYFTAK